MTVNEVNEKIELKYFMSLIYYTNGRYWVLKVLNLQISNQEN